MPKFRKKPVVIEAIRVNEALHLAARNFWGMPEWLIKAYDEGIVLFGANPSCVYIKTLEGEMRGEPGDWLIQGVQGELYPCKPDIFEATYEPA